MKEHFFRLSQDHRLKFQNCSKAPNQPSTGLNLEKWQFLTTTKKFPSLNLKEKKTSINFKTIFKEILDLKEKRRTF